MNEIIEISDIEEDNCDARTTYMTTPTRATRAKYVIIEL